MKVFLFPSKSRPLAPPYHTTLHDDGGISCDCPARVVCIHKKTVRDRKIIGRQEALSSIISRRNLLIIKSFADEGDINSALACTRDCFPSMGYEEVCSIYNEIIGTEDDYEGVE